MADVALWSGATGANNGSSWADAYTTLGAALAAYPTTPLTIYVASDHSELVSAKIAFGANPNYATTIISCDRTSGYPPTAEKAGAVIGSTSAFAMFMQSNCYSKGVFWESGDNSTASRNFTHESESTATNTVFRCVGGGIRLKNTGSTSRFVFGTGATNRAQTVMLENATVQFGHTGQGIQMNNARFRMSGGSVIGSAITELFKTSSNGFLDVAMRGVDLSACATGFNFLASSQRLTGRAMFDRCKMPSGWTGGGVATPINGNELELVLTNCDSADTNYRAGHWGANSRIRTETAIVRTGGASDGATSLSWAVITGDLFYPGLLFDTPEILVWNETVGSPITVTAHTVTDGITLKDDEAWIEVVYLGDSTRPLGATASDERPTLLSAASNQAASSAAWTTTGLTSPVTQQLSVTFTPQEKGYLRIRVRFAKSNATIYLCPKVEVT